VAINDFDPEAHDDYAPNPVQLEFIRLSAEKYHYLALGDTQHDLPHIRAFTLNSKTVAALAQAGKKNFFLELDPAAQYYCDYLRRDDSRKNIIHLDIEKITEGRKAVSGFWLDEEDSEATSKLFERSVRANRGVRFIPADMRMSESEEFRRLLPRLDLAMRLSDEYSNLKVKPEFDVALWRRGLNSALSACFRLAGRCSGRVRHMADDFVERSEKTLVQELTQDQKTADYIKSVAGPAAFSYGAGHFEMPADGAESPHNLGTLLRADGKSLCVLNVYKDRAQIREAEEKLADAELFVGATPKAPHGIKINNPDLQPLYEQALANVQAGRTFQLTTFQPLPS
jgi:hypothetical protein